MCVTFTAVIFVIGPCLGVRNWDNEDELPCVCERENASKYVNAQNAYVCTYKELFPKDVYIATSRNSF